MANRVTRAGRNLRVQGPAAGRVPARLREGRLHEVAYRRVPRHPGRRQPRRPAAAARAGADALAGPPGVEEFVVVGTKAEAIEAARAESDKLVNTLNAAEISKFAANDVADALKFVPGVSVQKGQFAIIRGLEDRYSSVLYNDGPIPSPDPDRQSVQLDLFPSEVVSDIVVTKTFAPELPSNSSGGSIDIVTHDYPEGFEVKGSSAVQLNSNAKNKFIHFDNGSSVGTRDGQLLERAGQRLRAVTRGPRHGHASARSATRSSSARRPSTRPRTEPSRGSSRCRASWPSSAQSRTVTRTGGLALGQLA